MKRRNRKKAYDCAHYSSERVLIDNVPYDMYGIDIYCKLGKFDEPKDVFKCETCTKFCVSRPMIRKKREKDKFLREYIKEGNKYYNSVFKAGRWEEQDY